MKSNESTILIFRRKIVAGVKQQAIGCKVCRKRPMGQQHFRHQFLPSPPYSGDNIFVLKVIVINIRPATIGAFMHFIHRLGWKHFCLFFRIILRVKIVQLISAVLQHKQRICFAVPVKPNHILNPIP